MSEANARCPWCNADPMHMFVKVRNVEGSGARVALFMCRDCRAAIGAGFDWSTFRETKKPAKKRRS